MRCVVENILRDDNAAEFERERERAKKKKKEAQLETSHCSETLHYKYSVGICIFFSLSSNQNEIYTVQDKNYSLRVSRSSGSKHVPAIFFLKPIRNGFPRRPSLIRHKFKRLIFFFLNYRYFETVILRVNAGFPEFDFVFGANVTASCRSDVRNFRTSH